MYEQFESDLEEASTQDLYLKWQEHMASYKRTNSSSDLEAAELIEEELFRHGHKISRSS